ncbi:hypothetical protein BASA60_007902 [Batrachochytrium salamandrivorans]|nr:hypothetical protein BASA60_007902 [Batrachochytrium salamandrivorans]
MTTTTTMATTTMTTTATMTLSDVAARAASWLKWILWTTVAVVVFVALGMLQTVALQSLYVATLLLQGVERAVWMNRAAGLDASVGMDPSIGMDPSVGTVMPYWCMDYVLFAVRHSVLLCVVGSVAATLYLLSADCKTLGESKTINSSTLCSNKTSSSTTTTINNKTSSNSTTTNNTTSNNNNKILNLSYKSDPVELALQSWNPCCTATPITTTEGATVIGTTTTGTTGTTTTTTTTTNNNSCDCCSLSTTDTSDLLSCPICSMPTASAAHRHSGPSAAFALPVARKVPLAGLSSASIKERDGKKKAASTINTTVASTMNTTTMSAASHKLTSAARPPGFRAPSTLNSTTQSTIGTIKSTITSTGLPTKPTIGVTESAGIATKSTTSSTLSTGIPTRSTIGSTPSTSSTGLPTKPTIGVTESTGIPTKSTIGVTGSTKSTGIPTKSTTGATGISTKPTIGSTPSTAASRKAAASKYSTSLRTRTPSSTAASTSTAIPNNTLLNTRPFSQPKLAPELRTSSTPSNITTKLIDTPCITKHATSTSLADAASTTDALSLLASTKLALKLVENLKDSDRHNDITPVSLNPSPSIAHITKHTTATSSSKASISKEKAGSGDALPEKVVSAETIKKVDANLLPQTKSDLGFCSIPAVPVESAPIHKPTVVLERPPPISSNTGIKPATIAAAVHTLESSTDHSSLPCVAKLANSGAPHPKSSLASCTDPSGPSNIKPAAISSVKMAIARFEQATTITTGPTLHSSADSTPHLKGNTFNSKTARSRQVSLSSNMPRSPPRTLAKDLASNILSVYTSPPSVVSLEGLQPTKSIPMISTQIEKEEKLHISEKQLRWATDQSNPSSTATLYVPESPPPDIPPHSSPQMNPLATDHQSLKPLQLKSDPAVVVQTSLLNSPPLRPTLSPTQPTPTVINDPTNYTISANENSILTNQQLQLHHQPQKQSPSSHSQLPNYSRISPGSSMNLQGGVRHLPKHHRNANIASTSSLLSSTLQPTELFDPDDEMITVRRTFSLDEIGKRTKEHHQEIQNQQHMHREYRHGVNTDISECHLGSLNHPQTIQMHDRLALTDSRNRIPTTGPPSRGRARQRCVTAPGLNAGRDGGRDWSLSPLSASVSDSFARSLFADLSNSQRRSSNTDGISSESNESIEPNNDSLDMGLDIGFDLALGIRSGFAFRDTKKSQPFSIGMAYIDSRGDDSFDTEMYQPSDDHEPNGDIDPFISKNDLSHSPAGSLPSPPPLAVLSLTLPAVINNPDPQFASLIKQENESHSPPPPSPPPRSPPMQHSHHQHHHQRPYSPDCYLDSSSLSLFPSSLSHGLTRLILDNNAIQIIPESAFEVLVDLRVLSMANNHLVMLPSSIGLLSKLERLCMRNNRLESLPIELADLTSLHILDLGGNKLKYLEPRLFLRMNQLHTLILSSNHLRHLPPSLGYLAPSLCAFYVFNNPFSHPFCDLVEPVIQAFPAVLPTPDQLYGAPLSDVFNDASPKDSGIDFKPLDHTKKYTTESRSSQEQAYIPSTDRLHDPYTDMHGTNAPRRINGHSPVHIPISSQPHPTHTIQSIRPFYPGHGYLLRLLGFLRDELDLSRNTTSNTANSATSDMTASSRLTSTSLSTLLNVTRLPGSFASDSKSNRSSATVESMGSDDTTIYSASPERIRTNTDNNVPPQLLSPLSPMPSGTDKRRFIIAEFVSTETTYVDELCVLCDLYLYPLTHSEFMSAYDIETIFTTVLDPILAYHRDYFLPGMRYITQTDKCSLGAFFSASCEFLLDHYTVYMNNFDQSAAYIKHLETMATQSAKGLTGLLLLNKGGSFGSSNQSNSFSGASNNGHRSVSGNGGNGFNSNGVNNNNNNNISNGMGVSSMLASLSSTASAKRASSRKFASFLKQTKLDPRHTQMSFGSYLVLPIQRLPRYKLLLDLLVKETDPSHPEYECLVQAANDMRRTVELCNESKRLWDSLAYDNDRVRDARQRIKICPGSLNTGLLTHPSRSNYRNSHNVDVSSSSIHNRHNTLAATPLLLIPPQRVLIKSSHANDLRVLKYVESVTATHVLDAHLVCHGKLAKHRVHACHALREHRFNVVVAGSSLHNGPFDDMVSQRGAREIEAGGAVAMYGVPLTQGKRCSLVLFSDVLCWCSSASVATGSAANASSASLGGWGGPMQLIKVFGRGSGRHDKMPAVFAEMWPVLDADPRLSGREAVMRISDLDGVLYVRGALAEISSWVDAIRHMSG